MQSVLYGMVYGIRSARTLAQVCLTSRSVKEIVKQFKILKYFV